MTTDLNFDHFDTAVRPVDDLYRHANGSWLKSAEIPEDKAVWGAFTMLREKAREDALALVSGLDVNADLPTPARQIADVFASFMDTATIDERGAEVLDEFFAKADAVASINDLLRTMGELDQVGVTSLFSGSVDANPNDPKTAVLFLGQGGLGLPGEAYYHKPEHAEVREAYVAHIGRLLGLFGTEDAEAKASQIMELETAIAACHWDNVRCRDIRAKNNPMTLDEIAEGMPGVSLTVWWDATGVRRPQVVINEQPTFFTDVAPLLSVEKLPVWRAWMRWHIAERFAMILPEEFVNERFSFAGTVLSGTPVLESREKRAVGQVEAGLADAVGRLYVDEHFSPESKQRVLELVGNLLKAYEQSIQSLDWMTPETKTQALDKLSKFTPKIGYPDEWRDFSALTTDRADLFGNVLAMARHEFAHHTGKIDGPVDPHEWFMAPHVVNAYYHPLRNEIVFPAAILQPPFFYAEADDALNYGGIGAVIGHEIGHGFDDQGSTCDGDGLLRNWWTDADREAFGERAAKLIEQYNALSPAEVPDQTVNGELTIGENIGDLGGLGISLKAYRIATEGAEAPLIDGRSGMERLFLSWAAVWASLQRTEAAKMRLAMDPHSPSEFRCNQIAKNLDAFHETFHTSEGDGMWMAPEDRVVIW